MSHERGALTHRIERLEREARRWRCAAVFLGGVLGIVGLLGATAAGPVPVAEEIRARRFVLVDEAGQQRAYLAMEPAGKLSDEMRNVVGSALAAKIEEPQPRLLLLGQGEGHLALSPTTVVISTTESLFSLGSESLVMWDGQSRVRVVLDSTGDTVKQLGFPPVSSLVLGGSDGKVLFKAP